MADDTRLAEASLLLNYSSQSYKEQMLLTKKLQETSSHEHGAIVKIEPNQLVENNVPSKLITPPPEYECSTEIRENSFFAEERYASPSGSEVSFTLHNCDTSIARGDTVQDDDKDGQINNSYELDREPINNLLAAVNCAMPGIKSRPNILQRSATYSHIAPKSPYFLPKTYDHNYCQQDQGVERLGHRLNFMDQKTFNVSNYDTDPRQDGPTGATADSSVSKTNQRYLSSKNFNMNSKPLKLIAIHLGAGNSHNEAESLQLAKMICEEVMLQTSYPHLIPTSKKKRNKLLNSQICASEPNQNQECCGKTINNEHMDADLAVIKLVQRMEDHQSLNCGFGSNLNMKGQVECDASFMSERTHMWTGVGAISGCKNPILLAKSLFDHRTIQRPLGLIQPNLLVGSGAKQWMREHCPHLAIMDSKMVSSRAFSTYQKLKSRYDAASRMMNHSQTSSTNSLRTRSKTFSPVESNSNTSVRHPSPPDPSINFNEQQEIAQVPTECYISPTDLDHGFYCMNTRNNLKRVPSFAEAHKNYTDFKVATDEKPEISCYSDIEFQTIASEDYRYDTVGAIAVDRDNNFASAISSGGLLLKYKGRVGQAAVPGAGCWSEDSVAVTTTGVGEYLTLNMFARKFYDKMITLRLLHDLGHVDKKPDLSDLISCGMEECFEDLIKSPALDHVLPHERLAGMLSVSSLNSKNSPKRVDDDDLYLSYAHNTNSMCVGFMTCNDIIGHSVMSRNSMNERDGRPMVKTMKFSLDTNNCTETSVITRSSSE